MPVLTNADTTPSVAGLSLIRTNNTSTTSITGFDGGVAGQIVTLFIGDSLTSLKHNGAVGSEIPLYLQKSADYTCSSGDAMQFIFDGTYYWWEIKTTS
jgi:hypothetical protein